MVLSAAIILAASVNKAPDRACCIAILQAWESRFERVQVTYSTDAPTTYKCINFPGHVQLWQEGNEPICLQDIAQGTSLYQVSQGKVGDRWQKSYGTMCAPEIVTLKASARQVLYRLGVLVSGELHMSEVAALSSDIHVARRGRLELLNFTVPPGVHNGPTAISVSYDSRLRAPVRIESRWLGYREQTSFDWSSRTLSVRHVLEAPDGTRWDQWHISAVEPVLHEPASQEWRLSEGYFDSATATSISKTQGAESISETQGEVVMSAALHRRLLSADRPVAANDCGPMALYYLLNLSGTRTSPRQVEAEFAHPLYGTNMAEIAEASAAKGRPARIGFMHSDGVGQVPLPAIICMAPSHFVVLVAIDGDEAMVINPPGQVDRISLDTIRVGWNRFALWLDRRTP